MNKYLLHGKLVAQPGHGEQLRSILLKASEQVSASPGCRLYLISRDESDPDTVWVTEVWESKEDHAHSLQDEGVKELITHAMPILKGKPEGGQELIVVGGVGIGKE
jgi:quinol monooxygenase YgiN